jgi:hypothetical protein
MRYSHVKQKSVRPPAGQLTTWLYRLSRPRQTVLIWVCYGTDNTFSLCPLAVHTSLCLSSSSSFYFVFIFFILSLHQFSIFSFCSDPHPPVSFPYFLLSVGLPPLPPADQCNICNLPLYNVCVCVCDCTSPVLHAVSGLCSSVDEVFAFLGWFTACAGSCVAVFWGSIDYLILEDGINLLATDFYI